MGTHSPAAKEWEVNNNRHGGGVVGYAAPAATAGGEASQVVRTDHIGIPAWTGRGDGQDPEWIQVENNTSDPTDYIFDVIIREIVTEGVARFQLGQNCMAGTCSCMHRIEGIVSQMKPCRVFAELFMWGDTDPDAEYIMKGVCFGFMVINWDCDACYGCGQGAGGDWSGREAMSLKLRREIEAGSLTVVADRPTCMHRLFCIPKEGGGVRGIVDCSQPEGRSVNNYMDKVTMKFSYNSCG